MGVKSIPLLLILIAAASTLAAIASANKEWGTAAGNWNHTGANYWGYRRPNATHPPSHKFIVGGSQNWRFGFNYTDWAIKTGPFFLNDTLVFNYDPPNDTTFPHSVYLLPDFWSFQNCDLRRARKVGETTAGGGGGGFEFVLKMWRPYYFACGEHGGVHCKDGLMKFAVWPLIRWY